jgi:hypothetical protein
VKGQWEERFESRYGFWRGFVDEQVRRYLDCGLFENGFARIRCPECAEEYLLAFSCKTRELCPSCSAERSAATAALLLSWRHTGSSVHNRVRVEPEEQPSVERLARYIMRPPISLERMSWDGAGVVRYRRKGGHERPGLQVHEVETFDPAEVP